MNEQPPSIWHLAVGGSFLLLFMLGLISILRVDDSEPAPEEQTLFVSDTFDPRCEGENRVYRVTASELEKAFDANEAAAMRDYGNRFLAVEGTVGSVALDYEDKPSMHFETDGLIGTHARFCPQYEAQAADLVQGETVTLGCVSLSESLGVPTLSSCQVFPAGWQAHATLAE